MMASKILSRFLPGAESALRELPLYERPSDRGLEAGLPQHEDDQDDRFRDELDEQELDNMLVEATGDSVAPEESANLLRTVQNPSVQGGTRPGPSHAFQPLRMQRVEPATLEEEDDVPASLLMEDKQPKAKGVEGVDPKRLRPYQGPSASHADVQWRVGQNQQRLHVDDPQRTSRTGRAPAAASRTHTDPKEQALWRWTNVQNVDGFLLEVYQYFTDHGIWSIVLSRAIYILTTAFLFGLYMFLSACIDFKLIPQSKSTAEILIPQCMQKTSFGKNVLLWVFTFWWLWTIFRYVMDARRLWHLHQFYHHLLGIADIDLQTIPWERVVEGLMHLRNHNPETAEMSPRKQQWMKTHGRHAQSKQRMDAHDIANRLMRRDNYYIAMINKEKFDFSLPMPFLGHRQFYSKSLEWCIGFVFTNFIFDEHGHVQASCLEVKSRRRIVETLRRRLRFAALISVFMAPFNIGAQCIYYFSRYYAEFRNSPAQLGARAFTPFAEWKMREFNELDHDFQRRTRMAYPFADQYLNQFPKDKTNQIMQFVSLVTGTVAAILGIATLLDPELFLGFEITPGRTAFFYLSICMGAFATTRNAVPDDNEVHEPVLHLIEVYKYTHYCPERWKKQLHSNNVRVEFSALYQMKVLIFLEEMLSLVVAPLILWRNADQRSEQIIDFFRQSTVHVDGLGHLCDHAVFDFRKKRNVGDEDEGKDVEGLREEYFATRDDKMAVSQYYFMQRNLRYEHGKSARYQQHYGAMHMPPNFPVPQSLRDAATRPAAAATRPSPRLPAAATAVRSPSPHQSILLDLPHKRHASAPLGRGAERHQRPRKPHAGGPEDALAEEDVETADFADLTTSKLIDQDSELADDWKTFPAGSQEAGAGMDASTRGNDGGVLGLLVEYSKAHAEGKGQRRGGGNFT